MFESLQEEETAISYFLTFQSGPVDYADAKKREWRREMQIERRGEWRHEVREKINTV